MNSKFYPCYLEGEYELDSKILFRQFIKKIKKLFFKLINLGNFWYSLEKYMKIVFKKIDRLELLINPLKN